MPTDHIQQSSTTAESSQDASSSPAQTSVSQDRDEKPAEVRPRGLKISLPSPGTRGNASAFDQVTPTVPPPPATSVKFHYLRRDGSYEGFGLHVWGDGVFQETTWQAPIYFDGEDGFGRVAEVQIKDVNAPVSFIVHRGEEKDPPTERTIIPSATPEVWIKQGRPDIWTQEPPFGPEVVHAVIVDKRLILVRLEGPGTQTPGCPPASRLTLSDHKGEPHSIESMWCEGGQIFLKPHQELDLDRNYFLSLDHSQAPARIAGHLLDAEFFYEGDDLGATLAEDGSVLFKLWSPPATQVVLNVYSASDQARKVFSKPLTRGAKGVFETTLTEEEAQAAEIGTWDGCFYQYAVTAYGKTERALDPYAKSMAAFTPGQGDPMGKAAIVRPRSVDPFGFDKDDFANFGHRQGKECFCALKNLTDFMGYEVHVRDFTIDPKSGVLPEARGTFRGMASKAPLEHLKRLGITHVQLMPVMACYSAHECAKEFTDGRIPTRHYNWGYDPQGYFSLDGWLSSSPSDPYARIREFKELVLALHRQRIGVILDVVYNHIYDARLFENVAPGCYLRLDQNGLPSGTTGAGPSLETRRKMTRKLIVDSATYFAREFNVDGFRFDLMEFMDNETLRCLRRSVGEDLVLHGEAWDFSDLPQGEATNKWNMPEEVSLAAFSDSNRDAYTGRMEGRGFAQGEPWILPRVQAAVIGNLRHFDDPNTSTDHYDRFAREPSESLNYLTIHDGFTLWDKLHLSMSASASIEERAKVAKMAFGMLFTSQGRLMLHGGDEFGRTKPLTPCDPEPGRAHTCRDFCPDPDLPQVTHLHENSYASPDDTNMIRWSRLGTEPYASMCCYVRDLIAMRKALPGLRMPNAEAIRRNLHFLAGSHTPMPADGAGYTSFLEVPELTLHFKNGPRNSVCFVAGEVFPSGYDKNPPQNPFAVRFDDMGRGSIRFSKAEIDLFHFGAWSSTNSLQIKLVTCPGQWWTFEGAYSANGNNMVRPTAIRADNSVEIDLSICDHVAGTPRPGKQPFAVFEIDQSDFGPEASNYRRLVVAYNSGKERLDLALQNLRTVEKWHVLLDENRFSLTGLEDTPVIVSGGSICIPAQSVTVVGRAW